MQGDSERVVSGNFEEVRNMPSFLEGTIVPGAIREIARLEDEVQEAKCALALAKESLAESFYDSSH
jgi:hypothetical protein